jgi:hypothetical protein
VILEGKKEFREKRSLVRHRISLVRNRTMPENKVHSLLDKYDYKSEFADIFGLKTLDVSTIGKLIMNTTLSAIENINLQIDSVSKELAKYGWHSDDVKGGRISRKVGCIDLVVARVAARSSICDINRFCRPLVHLPLGMLLRHQC